MFRKLGLVLLVAAIVAATGAHWAILQSVAWTTMLAGNLQTGSFSEAMQKTFDGEHPCCLCKKISAGKTSEKKSEFSSSVKKLEFVTKRANLVFSAPQDFCLLPELGFCILQRAHQPPTPPPRDLRG